MFEESSQDYQGTTAVVEKQQQVQAPGKQKQQQHSVQLNKHTADWQSRLRKVINFKVELGPSRKDILNFTNQLAVMIRAGISLQCSLEAIAEQEDNRKFKIVITNLKNCIEQGSSFSQALAEHPQVFSNLYINMVAAAEVSGSLSEMLQKLADYLDNEDETRSQVRAACVYPIMIAVFAVAVTIFLLCFVLPRFTAIFAGKEHLLPTATKILIASSVFLQSYWFLLVPAIGACLWGFWYFISIDSGRQWWDKTKLLLPLIKTLCRSLYITRSLHTMSVLTRAGVPILDTISITAQISGNILYKNMWLGVYQEVRQGGKIASSLDRYDLMPSNVVQMIRSGEDSGTLSDVLRDVAGYYARELKTVIRTVTSMIEPIMIVIMGILVGFIAMSIILPIFRMSRIVMGK